MSATKRRHPWRTSDATPGVSGDAAAWCLPPLYCVWRTFVDVTDCALGLIGLCDMVVVARRQFPSAQVARPYANVACFRSVGWLRLVPSMSRLPTPTDVLEECRR